MANVQASFGFRHIGYLSGGGPDYQQATRLIQSTNTTKIFFGDPVVKNASSAYIVQASSTASTLEGIFVGCVYTPSGGIPTWSPFWPGAAAVDATAYVVNAPNALFLVAALNTSVTPANIGQNIGFSVGTGSTVGGGFSAFTVDTNTLATTNTLPFQVYSMYQGIGNGSDTTTPYAWCVVTFNNERFKQLTGVA